MSLDADGSRQRKEFYTDTKAIYCVAEAGIGRTDVTVEILIRGLQRYDRQEKEFSDANFVKAYLESHPAPTGGAPEKLVLEFKRTSLGTDGKEKEDDDAPFEAGRYQCEAMIDGEVKGTAVFNVRFPECPTVEIKTGDRCAGFYELGTVCPQSGATGDREPECSCDETGWQC